MTQPNKSFLFASADPHVDDFGDVNFDYKLCLGILFHPRMIMHHGYYFNSERLISHMKRSPDKKSLFESACDEAVILPVFGPEILDFDGINRETKRRWGNTYQPDARLSGDYLLWTRLRKCIDNGINKATKESINLKSNKNLALAGGGYLKRMRNALQTDPDFMGDEELKRIWENTHRYRVDAVEAAAELSKSEYGEASLGRLELFQKVAAIISHGQNSVHDPKFRDIVKHSKSSHEIEAVARFVKWSNQIHQLNYGEFSESEVSLGTAFDDWDLKDIRLLGQKAFPAIERDESVTLTIELPSIKTLINQDAKEFFALRQNEGMVFFEILNQWMEGKDGISSDLLRDALEKYSKSICKKFGESHPATIIAKQVSTPTNPIISAADWAIGAFGTLVSMPGVIAYGIFKKTAAFYVCYGTDKNYNIENYHVSYHRDKA